MQGGERVKSDYTISQQEVGKYLIAKWEGGEEPSRVYEVNETEKGSLRCSCPSGQYRGWCKHQGMVREYQRGEERG